ncbi:LpxL/LpxP family acyltransferase [Atopomonas sediminilitoris]|uniref:LpxL/LpxP family acyltransferase n=1 Tax=Atopomonas sediminilitoris TaxID=2919919 RepID=UPI001F4D5CE7|nr:glycosyl transferase [Atopomonas sediminilitoris]MCJ8170371.1 glycosyl transferase [Atopomonas sediminilitoris]
MSQTQTWAQEKERGALILMRLLAWCAKHLGRAVISPVLHLIVLYFFIFGRQARQSSRQYQARLATFAQRPDWAPTLRTQFRHFMQFADALLDKLDAWQGKLTRAQLSFNDPELIPRLHASGQGVLLIGSHLGNLEVCRAMAELTDRVPLNVLVHTKHAAQFNQLLSDSGARHLNLIQVTEVGPDTMMMLSERLARGEWVVIVGDRIPVHGGRTVNVDFLKHPAPFPQGPYLLAGLLQCPVYLLFCLKQPRGFAVHLEAFSERIQWKRSTREAVIAEHAQRYAQRLEHYCLQAPLQWFNFYPFWSSHD